MATTCPIWWLSSPLPNLICMQDHVCTSTPAVLDTAKYMQEQCQICEVQWASCNTVGTTRGLQQMLCCAIQLSCTQAKEAEIFVKQLRSAGFPFLSHMQDSVERAMSVCDALPAPVSDTAVNPNKYKVTQYLTLGRFSLGREVISHSDQAGPSI